MINEAPTTLFDLLNTLHETINDTVFENAQDREEFNARVCFRLRMIKLALERAQVQEKTSMNDNDLAWHVDNARDESDRQFADQEESQRQEKTCNE